MKRPPKLRVNMLTLLKSPRACALFILLSATGCGEPEPEQTSEEEALIFVEVAQELGISFTQSPGEHPDFPLPASMGGGVALFDADALDTRCLLTGPV